MATNTTIQQQEKHWRDRAISTAEGISDAFDVAKAYGAHIANWILFFCLIANLIEMVSPGFETWAGLFIVAVQSISLDIAGFGLTAMAGSAKRRGDDKSAFKANFMGWTLITVMSITVGLITVAAFKHEWASAIQQVNEVFMFIRVIVTVFYGHIVHQLREEGTAHEHRLHDLETTITALRREVEGKQRDITETTRRMEQAQKTHADLQVERAREQESARVEIDSLRGKLSIKAGEVEMMATDQAGILELRREIREAKSETDDLKAQLSREQMLTANLRREVESLHQNEAHVASLMKQNEALLRQRVTVNEAPVRQKNEAMKQRHEAKILPQNVTVLKQIAAPQSDKRSLVYRLDDSPERLSSYDIAEQTGIPVSTVQRYLRERKSASHEATGTDE